MRIIHTADWHLCDRLGRIDRTPHLRQRVQRVAELCQEHAADVLLIAGDLFSNDRSVTLDHMVEELVFLKRTFEPFFARGGTILAVTGNHDIDQRIDAVRAGMTLASPIAAQDGRLPPGRMYLANGRALAWINSPAGHTVQFVLLPYPFPHRYDLSNQVYRTREEEHRLLHGQIATWLRELPQNPRFDFRLPTVLVAHLAVRGSDLGGLSRFTLTEQEDILFDYADLNPAWSYVALGHIHKPQAVAGLAHVRYPGSLDRLDFGETHGDHGVLRVDIGPQGLLADPVHLPIPATPFETLHLDAPATDLPTLAEKYPDRESLIVRVQATPPTDGITRDEIARELRRLFPQLHGGVAWDEPSSPDAAEPDADTPTFTPRSSMEATVREYLLQQLQNDPDREALLALAEQFLQQQRFNLEASA